VLVTGGSSGIGAAVVRRLSRAGYQVSFTVNRSVQSAEALCAELAGGARPRAIACDLSDELAVDRLCRSLVEEERPFYGLVHAAGASYDVPAGAADLGKARAIMQVNFWSLFSLVRALLPVMTRHRRGRIVGVGSVVSRRGSRGNSVYASTKGALESFLVNLVGEAAHKGVTVNAVVPGFIATPLLEPYAAMRDHLMKRIPAGDYGSPDQVAAVVEFLLSPDAAYMNGARVVVDGGLDASMGLSTRKL
jgi:NAD(P)-dependent dehydrogenase (short-subunit alcohol dehydrogenase family)